jgi:hypothetical protein
MKIYHWVFYDQNGIKEEVTIKETNIYQQGNIKKYNNKFYKIQYRHPGRLNNIEFCIATEVTNAKTRRTLSDTKGTKL